MKKAVNSEKAPAAVGPYSHANTANGFVFVSGQLGLDPETGVMAEGTLGQAAQGFKNLENVLEACGSSTGLVVKTTVFLTDISEFAEVNKLYAEVFASECPARSCVQVAALPMGASFEIEAIAVQA
ncbi:MAG: Rid family detoxifying hydrolase [Eubacteriaceae bacterium]